MNLAFATSSSTGTAGFRPLFLATPVEVDGFGSVGLGDRDLEEPDDDDELLEDLERVPLEAPDLFEEVDLELLDELDLDLSETLLFTLLRPRGCFWATGKPFAF